MTVMKETEGAYTRLFSARSTFLLLSIAVQINLNKTNHDRVKLAENAACAITSKSAKERFEEACCVHVGVRSIYVSMRF